MNRIIVWLVYEPGGRDDPLELYGVFTSEEKAKRAAAIAGDCLSIDSVQLDALYMGSERGRGYYTPGALNYPQPDPNTDWDHMVVDAVPVATGGMIHAPKPGDDSVPILLSEGGCLLYPHGDHSGPRPADPDTP